VQPDASLEKELKETAREVKDMKSKMNSIKDYLQKMSAKLDSLVVSQPGAPTEARLPA
jgi:DNA anti-recombination protein RmuC